MSLKQLHSWIGDVYRINGVFGQEDELRTGEGQVVVDETPVVEKRVPLFAYGSEPNENFRWKTSEYFFLQFPWKPSLRRRH